jgi:hypothetical protein
MTTSTHKRKCVITWIGICTKNTYNITLKDGHIITVRQYIQN